MKRGIAVIGSGSWGTALARLLCNNGWPVFLWGRIEDGIQDIGKYRVNQRFLPGVPLPEGIKITSDEAEAVEKAETVVFVVPSQSLREVVRRFKPHIAPGKVLVSAVKGIENKTHLRMSQVIEEELGAGFAGKTAVLSGPSHAEEVARDIPTAVVSASADAGLASLVQEIFMTSRFRVYTNQDLVGVELGGALKNVIALSAGISDGLGYGDNTRAALITRGISEIRRLGIAMGANPDTFSGLSGLGDLVVTCNSMHSRNRRAGIMLGQGMKLPEVLAAVGMVVEGVDTSLAADELARRMGVEMPITHQICEVLFEGLTPREAVDRLMLRLRTHEIEQIND
ncbi:MAG: NAD(P)H-dependent glycerol-3-phosphate dehydrogenase [Firmicutes bacterium]|nr:NAD(P)H-dependent glycerol-3-phosphate dehydrogenase [Bacillota bacterium]